MGGTSVGGQKVRREERTLPPCGRDFREREGGAYGFRGFSNITHSAAVRPGGPHAGWGASLLVQMGLNQAAEVWGSGGAGVWKRRGPGMMGEPFGGPHIPFTEARCALPSPLQVWSMCVCEWC